MGQSVVADEVTINNPLLERVAKWLNKPYSKPVPPPKPRKQKCLILASRLEGTEITDTDLKELAKLQELKRLNLHAPKSPTQASRRAKLKNSTNLD